LCIPAAMFVRADISGIIAYSLALSSALWLTAVNPSFIACYAAAILAFTSSTVSS